MQIGVATRKWSLLWGIVSFLILWPSTLTATNPNSLNGKKILTIATMKLQPLLGQDKGLFNDIVRAAFATQGTKVSFTLYPMTRVPWSISKAKHCIALGSILWFDDKARSELNSIEIYNISAHFFYLKSRFPLGLEAQSSAKFPQYRIGTIRGGVLEKTIKHKGLDANLQLVNHMKQNVQKVVLNRLDMFASPLLAGLTDIQKFFPERADEFTYSKERLFLRPADIVFTKQCHQEFIQFQKGFAKLQHSGHYKKIIQAYFLGRAVPDYVYAPLTINDTLNPQNALYYTSLEDSPNLDRKKELE
ncbi:transporter substrate-binding domain-containing protein [Vibrio profundum]|uniref:substrate-binding periplasmic protein n=1 Tax=Vibrio profundum TaxID=2910247 RepID=UPI003D0B0FF7